jgi:serine/threonine protein kinase
MTCRKTGLEYLKIADWGLCRQTSIPLKQYTPEVQTILYRAPEIVLLNEADKDYMAEIDIWSCALIIIEMFIAKPYLRTNTEAGLITQWKQKIGFPPAALYGDKTSVRMEAKGHDANLMEMVFDEHNIPGSLASKSAVITLIRGMLDWHPLKRLRASECLSSTFLRPMFRNDRIKILYTDIAADKGEYTTWEEGCVGTSGSFNKTGPSARDLITPPNDNDVLIDAMDISDSIDQEIVAAKKQKLQYYLRSP